MKLLLEIDFCSYYNGNPLQPHQGNVSVVETNVVSFSLDDKQFFPNSNKGVANYENKNQHHLNVINYDEYIESLPPRIKNHIPPANPSGSGQKCDFIIYGQEIFLLNELTEISDVSKRDVKRKKARYQLVVTLETLNNVPSIKNFMSIKNNRICVFFNKVVHSPPTINATLAFNQVSSVAKNGLEMIEHKINQMGFRFVELSNNEVFSIL